MQCEIINLLTKNLQKSHYIIVLVFTEQFTVVFDNFSLLLQSFRHVLELFSHKQQVAIFHLVSIKFNRSIPRTLLLPGHHRENPLRQKCPLPVAPNISRAKKAVHIYKPET